MSDRESRILARGGLDGPTLTLLLSMVVAAAEGSDPNERRRVGTEQIIGAESQILHRRCSY